MHLLKTSKFFLPQENFPDLLNSSPYPLFLTSLSTPELLQYYLYDSFGTYQELPSRFAYLLSYESLHAKI
jgi:hypothetical protein